MRLGNLLLLLAATVMAGLADPRTASAEGPQGVWLVDGEAAVEIFNCGGVICGRLLWLQAPHDAEGQPKRDNKNPDPALRQRQLCGLTIMWDLHSAGPNQWDGGWLYYPKSGQTYNVKAELTSSGTLIARFYQGSSIVGETKTLTRVRHGPSEGCR
jgi:uncharacterized protein (DUF2147 family)